MSSSNMALIPAINIVRILTIKSNSKYLHSLKILLNRTSRYTPAVTRVEECTKEDTGVSAAIAAGNHAENGIVLFLYKQIQ